MIGGRYMVTVETAIDVSHFYFMEQEHAERVFKTFWRLFHGVGSVYIDDTLFIVQVAQAERHSLRVCEFGPLNQEEQSIVDRYESCQEGVFS